MWRTVTIALALSYAGGAAAHHSYAMFDGSRTVTVIGTMAKLEWTNPHVFIWVWVPDANGEPVLYAFENGSPNVLTRRGWSKNTFAPQEKLAITYWPLADGRTGGHFAVATRVDGSEVRAAGGPGGDVNASASIPAPPPPTRSRP
jgi:hypothetical protein